MAWAMVVVEVEVGAMALVGRWWRWRARWRTGGGEG